MSARRIVVIALEPPALLLVAPIWQVPGVGRLVRTINNAASGGNDWHDRCDPEEAEAKAPGRINRTNWIKQLFLSSFPMG